MKAYLLTTAVVFGLLTLAHLWRITVEPHLATDFWYVLITMAAALMCAWAAHLLRTLRRKLEVPNVKGDRGLP